MPGTARSVSRKANREKWPFVEVAAKGGPGGKRKEFSIQSLPQITREYLAIQNAAASGCLYPANSAAAAGAAIGEQIATEAAESHKRFLANQEQSLAEFSTLPPEQQQVAKARLALLEARNSYKKTTGIRAIVPASKKFAVLYMARQIKLPDWIYQCISRKGKPSLSYSSLNRWDQDYKAHGIMGLVDDYKSPSKTSVPKDVREFIQALKTAHPDIKMQRIFDVIDARFDGRADKPSHSAIRRYTNKWESENESLLLFLKNPDAWKNEQMLALGSASEKVVALNQLWEMDSTPTDVMLTDGRHTIVGCLDVWSRRAKMLVAPTSKAAYVSSLARRCMIEWGCPPAARENQGVFDGIKTDNGSDYTAESFELVLESLAINHPICPPFTPEAKPHIERFFRTFAHGIVELMPGFIGHNVNQRKAIEARRSFAKRLMKRGEDPIKIEMSSEEFQILCDRWCEAIYHQDVHSELGMTPDDKARSWTGPIRKLENERALDMLLLSHRGVSTLQKKGIKIDHGWYVAAEFALLSIGEKLRVYEDPTDYGYIYVYKPSGEFICVAQDPTRTGIDRAELASRAKAIQKQIMNEGAKVLRKQARQLGAEKAFEEILEYREKLLTERTAKVTTLPQRTETYTTEALQQAGLAADARQNQVIDPHERRKERQALKEAMEEAGKLAEFPTDSTGRIRFYRQLKRRFEAGEQLSERESTWFDDFRKKPEGRMMAELEKDCLTANVRQ